jgi:hypothetical protein
VPGGILGGDINGRTLEDPVTDKVTLTLAYPLSAAQAERVLADDVKDYWVGDKITVRRDYALSVINAGYAKGVDPADRKAVNEALGADAAQVGTEAVAPQSTPPVDDAEPKKTSTRK